MKQFHYPKFYRWLSVVAVLLFGSLSIIGTGFVLYEYKNVSKVLIFLPVSLFLSMFTHIVYDFFRRRNDTIMVDDSAIHVIGKDDSKHSIHWNDIYTIHERPLSQRMDLRNRFEETLLKIDYQLVGFDNLCQIILSKKSDSNNPNLENNFVSSWFIRGLFIASVVFFGSGAIASFVDDQFDTMWGFAGFVLLSIIGYSWEVKRITVDENSVTIKSFFKRRTYRYSDIIDVNLKNDNDGKGNLISTVFLFFGDKEPVKVAGIQGGIFAVYESIKSAWEKDRQIFTNEK
ncbi:MAG: hypothetical protein JEZ12_21705 [Desulfobacterium sp.]|nr:hypothetical protein [Desulfobacterium sp.]